MTTLVTARLRLEPYAAAHLEGLHAIHSDREVMRFITGRPETLEETRAIIARVAERWATVGYSWWAFVEQASGEIVGSGCIQNLRRASQPQPDPDCPLEIGWRLRRDRHGRGLASEAAAAMAGFAFGPLRGAELYAVCDPANRASAKVMERLGMAPLGLQTWYGRESATYRIGADDWARRAGQGGAA